MKNKVVLIIVIILFLGLLIFINNFLNNRQEKISENSLATNSNTQIVQNSKSKESKVKTVTKENFEEEVLKSNNTVLIDFYADWCTPCKMLSPIVEQVAKENDRVKVVKINIDKNQELANKYNIISIPVLLVIKNGKEVNRSIGYIEKNQIEKMINI